MSQWKVAALAATVSGLALVGTAGAQTAPGERETVGLEEVVVTARRVEENLQTVPITVQAFSNETLERQDIDNPNKLGALVPGLSFCCSANASQPNTTFRGVPGIIGYYAEAPTSLDGRALYFDLANVQILKGPQGTLFGLSANSGALLLVPKKPVDHVEGYVEAVLGNYGRRTLEGVLNVPLVDDKVLLRAGVVSHSRDGWIHDINQNKDVSDENYWTGRVSATVKPAEDVENYLTLNYHKFHNNGDPFFMETVNPTGPAANRYTYAVMLATLQAQQALGPYKILGAGVADTQERRRQVNLTDILTWDIGDNMTLKNVAGWLQTKIFTRTDSDSTPLQISESSPLTLPPGPTDQYSEELQLQGKLFGDRLAYTVGTFHSWIFTNPSISYNNSIGTVTGSITETAQNTHAVYAQGTYDLSDWIDGLSFTGGYRYTWDFRKSGGVRYNAQQIWLPTTLFGFSGNFKAPSYTLQLNYQVTPDVMLYINNSKGYSSGGFNPVGTPAQFYKFDPESLNNIEGGIKAEWRMGAVQARTNLSAYYGFYDDIQVTVTRGPFPNPAGGVSGVQITENAATGYVSGGDLDFTLVFGDKLELTGAVGYVHDRYNEWLSLDANLNVVNLKNTPFRYTPDWKGSAIVTYHVFDTPELGHLSGTLSWAGQSSMIGSQPIPPYAWPGLYVMNLDIKWADFIGRSGLDASFFVTNLTENKIDPGAKLGGYVPSGAGGARWKPPRMYGVKLHYGF